MNIWFRKNFGDAMLAYLELDEVEIICLSAYEKASYPNEMAVFLRHESEGRLQCEVIVYFSPAMSHIVGAFGATPCEQPAKFGLSLLIGSPIAWSLLFPEEGVQNFVSSSSKLINSAEKRKLPESGSLLKCFI